MREVKVKTILNKHKKRDEWFLDDYSINPYYGCSFNCVYCYIKGSKYGREEFGIKINAPEILEKEIRIRARKREYGFIVISSSTEPYMPIEKDYKITRKLLKIIAKYRFPVNVATKSTLVLRDIDLLKEIDKNSILPKDLKGMRKAVVSFSISTLDEKLAKIVEPMAPPPSKRLETMKKCKEEGLFAGICYIPVLPFLSDSEEQIEEMIKIAKEYGADFVLIGGLTLNNAYYKFLEKHFPDLVPKYKELNQKAYLMKLEKLANELCRKYKIKNSLM